MPGALPLKPYLFFPSHLVRSPGSKEQCNQKRNAKTRHDELLVFRHFGPVELFQAAESRRQNGNQNDHAIQYTGGEFETQQREKSRRQYA